MRSSAASGARSASAPEVAEVPRDYHGPGAAAADVDLFCERVADYKATVHRVAAADVQRAVGEVLAGHGAERVAGTIEGFEDASLGARELDALDGVVTGCALGIAETGTIVLDGAEASGRRALTLVPDLHLCVVARGADRRLRARRRRPPRRGRPRRAPDHAGVGAFGDVGYRARSGGGGSRSPAPGSARRSASAASMTMNGSIPVR